MSVVFALVNFLIGSFGAAVGRGDVAREGSSQLESILKAVETRYGTTGFSADFLQESLLKAMDITDTASGRIIVKRPGMMRWEYDIPEKQLIINNGKTLWIYRPTDKQVMVGKSPEFFGDGKGAGFLSDITMLRKKFTISLETGDPGNPFVLKLVPLEKTLDFDVLYLYVDRDSHIVNTIITRNMYGDETTIRLSGLNFEIVPEDSQFYFAIPPGIDVLEISE
jgi:outer membrane lipoprotein carrier protein